MFKDTKFKGIIILKLIFLHCHKSDIIFRKMIERMSKPLAGQAYYV